MSANKRPSTSSLRRYLTSRPYLSVADIRRRFGLDPDAMSAISRNGTTAYIGLPEREASKLQDLWQRDEVGVELSVEVKAPVVVGVYPMRIARFVLEQAGSGANGNGHAYPSSAVTRDGLVARGSGNGVQPAPPMHGVPGRHATHPLGEDATAE